MKQSLLFTEHELTALRLLARGLRHTEIATALGVRPETAGLLLHRAQGRLRARTLAHAVARGYETGLIQPTSDAQGASTDHSQ